MSRTFRPINNWPNGGEFVPQKMTPANEPSPVGWTFLHEDSSRIVLKLCSEVASSRGPGSHLGEDISADSG